MKIINKMFAVIAGVMLAVSVMAADKPQTKCPIQGEEIEKKLYADVEGCRIYVCCKSCLKKVKADPAKAIATIKANGETPEKAPEKK